MVCAFKCFLRFMGHVRHGSRGWYVNNCGSYCFHETLDEDIKNQVEEQVWKFVQEL